MKRLIKFWDNYNDECEFSDCSTKYEIYPVLFSDGAGPRELMEFALSNGMAFKGVANVPKAYSRYCKLTDAIELKTKTKQDDGCYLKGTEKERVTWLGFISVTEKSFLKLKETLGNKVSKDEAYEIIDHHEFGVEYTCELNDKYFLVISEWGYYHALKFYGYSIESFEKSAGIQGRTFSDEVTKCDECDEYMWETNGYDNNYRIVDDCNLLGVECGCFAEYTKSNVEKYANKHETAIELEQAEELEQARKIKFISRFIGGMTDPGRGGMFKGEYVSNGQPEQVLAELLKTNPNGRYVFSHDESGQFQTYFSVWELVDEPNLKLIKGARK